MSSSDKFNKRERMIEELERIEKERDYYISQDMSLKYREMVAEYIKLNNLEPLDENDDQYMVDLYNFVNDAKFVDFALDRCGIAFSQKLFDLGYWDRQIEELGFFRNKDGHWEILDESDKHRVNEYSDNEMKRLGYKINNDGVWELDKK